MVDIYEEGEIYFFYKTKLDSSSVESLGDIQRFYLLLFPDRSQRGRMFLVGKKRLPKIIKKDPHASTAKEWLMLDLVAKPQTIVDYLRPTQYETRTRGTREQGEAIPAGQGRYALFSHAQHSELAYQLHQPKTVGAAQEQLALLPEASYVLSVRNPDVEVPGFPASHPDYPEDLKKRFADKRWINVDEPRLLDYEGAQLLLIGAHDTLDDIDISLEGQPDLFRRLGIDKERWPTETLEKGQLTAPEFKPKTKKQH